MGEVWWHFHHHQAAPGTARKLHHAFRRIQEEWRYPKQSLYRGRWHFLAYFGVTAKCGGEAGRDLVNGIGEIVRRSFEYEVL
ncbi:hypothetical protein P153DRAFT_190833 [Dothidotthia symphoricarpi CBS 119687]|uniref:Uncharacterized protein n=1 Tax=Dothidotthia symphoricarpi CBS 119687 TaxID=1392245 RepID=A0A6A6AMS1_9PLEO|nr:uncharacterized protein P153DRAFT_190833 [Dothidotthia symphoricarpi CBS 119687]KAF2132438.1 hypothetical protein P153DRAFT_190833 [Dothidotthia symphoricarpi CBS 119687]